ncbi:sigma-54 dependent transcriptional regulator [Methylicorpusculum oleiharenae]|uniref:sigma-54-dependent transcriptional regulator n=1 Tax=Methylicorpusculum oleiharenae TaxID=1338687 RepID=UPI001358D260|nr:sigma-54 dependent transcriptional regulator [Methylicorpusculum oleiharenae]MCD2453066.1 sigma-54 dependent transcriptional regulator [Methylicorpusculum oleiharenae]
MNSYDVLIVEDDKALCEALCDTLEIEGYTVLAAGNGTDAMLKLAENRFHLVVSDVQMPVMDGFQLLQNMQVKHKGTPLVLMTAYGTIPKAVAAIQAGAVDYLIKPFDAMSLVDKVKEFVAANPAAANDQIVQDQGMAKLYELITRVSKSDVTVLLQGESGVGKEVIARYIHDHSLYNQGPFVAINCAAIPESMLEAMLFGYEKGAFTGALQSMPGKFEQAQNGTLLLDEIAEMDIGLQAKLLRVLQEKEVERIGSQKKIPLTVRFLAATNQTLKQKVEQGGFREDLYYRLSVFPIKIPALRERPGDILPLAIELLRRHGGQSGSLPDFDAAAAAKLQAYSWPGNVRELENVVQRALILKSGESITVDDLMFEEGNAFNPNSPVNEPLRALSFDEVELRSSGGLDDEVRSTEEKVILNTLQNEQGSRKNTAEKLGISPRTLRYKLARMKESGVVIPC